MLTKSLEMPAFFRIGRNEDIQRLTSWAGMHTETVPPSLSIWMGDIFLEGWVSDAR